MTDRGFLFLVALVCELGALGAMIWLIASGQLGTIDGNFLFLCALTVAAAFGMYLKFMIAKAMEVPPVSKPTAPTSEKKAQAPELAGKV